MANLSVFDFEGYQVRFVGTAESPEWVAADVAKVLGIQNASDTLKRLEPYQKGVCTVNTFGGKQKMLTVTLDGLKVLIAKSRSPKARDLASKIGMDVYVSLIESDCIRVLQSAFADLRPVRQFSVHGYRIDLYLAAVNIAVECDEYGHGCYDQKKDLGRERIIKSALGCCFVRFNPDEPGFNIGDVILTIRGLI